MEVLFLGSRRNLTVLGVPDRGQTERGKRETRGRSVGSIGTLGETQDDHKEGQGQRRRERVRTGRGRGRHSESNTHRSTDTSVGTGRKESRVSIAQEDCRV